MSRKFQYVRWLGILLAFVLLLFAHEPLNAQSGSNRFYYYQGTRVPLDVNPNLVAVRFNASVSRATQKSIIDATGDVGDFDAGVESPVGGLVFVTLRAGRDPTTAVSRLSASVGVQFASPVYDFDSVQLAETDEFLVRFPQNLLPADIARLNQTNDVSIVRALPNSDRVFILKPNVGSVRSAREWANLYVETHIAEFAEPNFVLRETRPFQPAALPTETNELAPTDSNFGLQWSLKNTRQFQGSEQGADINATRAWDVTRGAGNIKIAVIDEGVFASHPELSGKVLPGYNALNGTGDTTPKIGDHHGTGVAGIIAAQSNNSAGIAGVCWLCQILPVQVAETDSHGDWVTTTGTLASGIDWAWQNGADVLNNSWTMNAPSDTVQLAIINARFGGRGGKGSTIVFASGNQNSSAVSFPGSLNSYVIAVGASNWCDQRKTPANNACNNGLNSGVWGSNYGAALDLIAPGEALYTTCNGSQCTSGAYTYLSGTSVSTPLVAGAAALLYALNPNLTPDQVQTALQNGAKDLGSAGRDNETGYGRLDAYRALAAMFNLKLEMNNSQKLVRPGETVEYKLKYSNSGSAAMGSTQIFVPLPANTTYVSSTPPFSLNSNTVYRLDLGTLPSNATGTALFRVQIQPGAAGKPVIMTASITGAFPESSSTDNTASNTAFGVRRDLFLPFLENAAH
jgi:thermitase